MNFSLGRKCMQMVSSVELIYLFMFVQCATVRRNPIQCTDRLENIPIPNARIYDFHLIRFIALINNFSYANMQALSEGLWHREAALAGDHILRSDQMWCSRVVRRCLNIFTFRTGIANIYNIHWMIILFGIFFFKIQERVARIEHCSRIGRNVGFQLLQVSENNYPQSYCHGLNYPNYLLFRSLIHYKNGMLCNGLIIVRGI